MILKHHHNAKLSYREIRIILDMIDAGIKQKEIADHFNVSPATITFIKYSRTYHYVKNKKN